MSATNRGSKRNEYDFYATPEWCTIGLMQKLNVDKSKSLRALEPCIGEGAIADVIKPYFETLDWCEIQKGKDFLTYKPEKSYDFIITNPPFSKAEEFIHHSLTMADCVVMLLRLNFLGGQKRYDRFWSTGLYTPTGIFICADRPSFTGKGTDATEYGWFIFDKTGNQPTGLRWLRRTEIED